MTRISEISRDSSSSFSEDPEETRVRKFAKHMLKSSIFMGTFQEKRFVEPLNAYRDVIKVCDDEPDFIDNLIAVRKRCAKFYIKNVWIGITEPRTIGAPAGYNLWVTLDEEVFGSYWYKVKTVEFHSNEVRLKLEVVRPIFREKTPVHNISAQQVLEDISQRDVSQLGVKLGSYMKERFGDFFSEILTIRNIKEAFVFIFLLLSTLITFLIQGTKYLMEYFLKLLHEFNGFIKVCTPIIINFMRLIMNTINGLYKLIAIMWTNRSSTPRVSQNVYQNMLPYESPYYPTRRALPPPYYMPGIAYTGCEGDVPRRLNKSRGSSVKITPLD